MALKPPEKYPAKVRQTLYWLVPNAAVRDPLATQGEQRYLLCHARRLHDSLRELPQAPSESARCLVVGSWGLEVPYLTDKLGWKNVTCVCAPVSKPGVRQRRVRQHPNESRKSFSFTLIEHDIESSPLPFPDQTFDLVVYWGCIEHLRHDPEFSLYELNRVCNAGATVSIVTDNAISFQATHAMLRGEPMPMRLHAPSAEGHWRLYTPPEVAELLEGTGWRVDLLTTIVRDPPVYWRWWKKFVFKRVVSSLRKGFGLSQPFWNAFTLVHATKIAEPTRCYPPWLYKDEKIRQLKVSMMELVSCESPKARSA